MRKTKKRINDYFIEETYEAGLVLQGTEIKSIRNGRVNLKDSFAKVEKGEVFLHNMHISPYEQGNRYNHDPLRTRKLLLHRREINKLIGYTKEQGYTLVPLKLYIKNGFAKVELGVAKGKEKIRQTGRHEAERSAARNRAGVPRAAKAVERQAAERAFAEGGSLKHRAFGGHCRFGNGEGMFGSSRQAGSFLASLCTENGMG
ncbi:SsrA-binding protein [Geobacillus sp. BCO2]|nr:SsrA-binding protein [Geobacillus sp. BCO2]